MVSSYIRRLPLWLRYLCALISGAILFTALVLYVSHNQQPLSEAPAAPNKSQAATNRHEDLILIQQEQAAHTKRLAPGQTVTAGAAAAVTADVTQQINQGGITAGALDGPATCTLAGASATRTLLHCNATVGDAAENKSLRYPFDAVFTRRTRTVTYCEVVTSPDPSLTSPPVPASCR